MVNSIYNRFVFLIVFFFFFQIDSQPHPRDSSDSDGEENNTNYSPTPVCRLLKYSFKIILSFCFRLPFIRMLKLSKKCLVWFPKYNRTGWLYINRKQILLEWFIIYVLEQNYFCFNFEWNIASVAFLVVNELKTNFIKCFRYPFSFK